VARCRRTSVGGYCYHAINRGNQKKEVFHDRGDYARFMLLIARACERVPMRLLAWCLMPNHFHLVLWPHDDGDMSRWMHWLLTSHVRWHHKKYETSGRIWQGRFKSFPIQQDEHLMTVERYVERNPLRAGLVRRAEEWTWSSLGPWLTGDERSLLHDGPVSRWNEWLRFVSEPRSQTELDQVRNSVNREAPFGDEDWTLATAARLDLAWTLRGQGRPSTVRRVTRD
jgi:putative transposase